MAKLSAIRTDPSKENSGVWVEYEGGIKLKIARMNNPAFEKFITDRQAPNIGRYRKSKQSDAERDKLIEEATAATILLDWANLDDEDGKPIPFSAAKALEFFRDPSLRDFYRFILLEASSADNFKKEALEEASGN